MALRAVAPVLVLGLAAFAGCLGTTDDVKDTTVPEEVATLLTPSKEPLFWSPEYFPHWAYDYPTMTNPAVGANVPYWWEPINATPLPSPIAGLEHLVQAPAEEVKAGSGMAVFGRLAVVPGDGPPTTILDITDPENPKVLSHIEGEAHRNVDFIPYPDGRLVAVFAGTDNTIPVWDLSDPANPVKLASIKPPTGVHKVNVMPGTPIVYNANSNGGASQSLITPEGHTTQTAVGQTEIYDLTDPANPLLVQEWKNGFGCHHVYFWNDPAENKSRTLCAGLEYTQIWNTADPLHPEVIVSVPHPHGVANTPSGSLSIEAFSHFSILNDDATILMVGDESGGGGIPPGCVAGASTPVGQASTPVGALWFYDVKDEKNPRLLGWFSPGQHFTKHQESISCTAHHGRLVPDAERDLVAMAFYGAGVVLVDFTDPMLPKLVDQWNDDTNTWEVQYYNGYLFTGDLARGMDVLKLR